MDLQAKAASDHASTPAIMTPAVVAATSSQYARRGGTLCESSITLTCPPVRNANARGEEDRDGEAVRGVLLKRLDS